MSLLDLTVRVLWSWSLAAWGYDDSLESTEPALYLRPSGALRRALVFRSFRGTLEDQLDRKTDG